MPALWWCASGMLPAIIMMMHHTKAWLGSWRCSQPGQEPYWLALLPFWMHACTSYPTTILHSSSARGTEDVTCWLLWPETSHCRSSSLWMTSAPPWSLDSLQPVSCPPFPVLAWPLLVRLCAPKIQVHPGRTGTWTTSLVDCTVAGDTRRRFSSCSLLVLPVTRMSLM